MKTFLLKGEKKLPQIQIICIHAFVTILEAYFRRNQFLSNILVMMSSVAKALPNTFPKHVISNEVPVCCKSQLMNGLVYVVSSNFALFSALLKIHLLLKIYFI